MGRDVGRIEKMTHVPLLLDTNILLQLVRNKELGQRLTVQFNLADAVYRPLISIVTVGEIWALADQFAFGAQKRQFLNKVLAAMIILDINDESVIESYVLVDRACRKAPGGARVLSKNDLWIGATAKAAGATLLTMDKDFLCLHPDCGLIHYVDSVFPHS
jgi:tRNA(fMet)-specific endonuclease VapC